MKKIEAVIRPNLLSAVNEALKDIGIGGMTITDALGAGKGSNRTVFYRLAKYEIEFVEMVKLEVVIEDEDAEAAFSAIFKAARTGKHGDGKIWMSSLEAVARIRTGEWNANAV